MDQVKSTENILKGSAFVIRSAESTCNCHQAFSQVRSCVALGSNKSVYPSFVTLAMFADIIYIIQILVDNIFSMSSRM